MIMHYISIIRNCNEVFIFEPKLQYEFLRSYFNVSIIFYNIHGVYMCVFCTYISLHLYVHRDLYRGIKITNRHSHGCSLYIKVIGDAKI